MRMVKSGYGELEFVGQLTTDIDMWREYLYRKK